MDCMTWPAGGPDHPARPGPEAWADLIRLYYENVLIIYRRYTKNDNFKNFSTSCFSILYYVIICNLYQVVTSYL